MVCMCVDVIFQLTLMSVLGLKKCCNHFVKGFTPHSNLSIWPGADLHLLGKQR